MGIYIDIYLHISISILTIHTHLYLYIYIYAYCNLVYRSRFHFFLPLLTYMVWRHIYSLEKPKMIFQRRRQVNQISFLHVYYSYYLLQYMLMRLESISIVRENTMQRQVIYICSHDMMLYSIAWMSALYVPAKILSLLLLEQLN